MDAEVEKCFKVVEANPIGTEEREGRGEKERKRRKEKRRK